MGPSNAEKLKHIARCSHLLTGLSLIYSLENFKKRNNLIWPGILPVQPHIAQCDFLRPPFFVKERGAEIFEKSEWGTQGL